MDDSKIEFGARKSEALTFRISDMNRTLMNQIALAECLNTIYVLLNFHRCINEAR